MNKHVYQDYVQQYNVTGCACLKMDFTIKKKMMDLKIEMKKKQTSDRYTYLFIIKCFMIQRVLFSAIFFSSCLFDWLNN